MSLLIFSLWIANVGCDTLGQVAFKFAATAKHNRSGWYYWVDLFRNYWLWIGIFAYVFEFLLWLAFLTLVPLSQGVLMASMNIITVMLVGRWLFHEKLTALRVIGIISITIGVALMGVS